MPRHDPKGKTGRVHPNQVATPDSVLARESMMFQKVEGVPVPAPMPGHLAMPFFVVFRRNDVTTFRRIHSSKRRGL
jgi:hypothetical protein